MAIEYPELTRLGSIFSQSYERYLPTSFDESMSILQKLNKIIEFMNQTGTLVNRAVDLIEESIVYQDIDIKALQKEMVDYKEEFETTLLPSSMTAVLDAWFLNGKLAQIINDEVFDMKADSIYVKRKEVDLYDYEHLATNKAIPATPSTWDWTVALQTAINDVIANTDLSRLKLPNHKVRISEAVGYWGAIDVDIGLHMSGHGRTASTGKGATIEQTNPLVNCLEFINGVSNIRGLVLTDFLVYGGKIGLKTKNSVYNSFENLSFSRQTEYCLYHEVGFFNTHQNCWTVHVHGNIMKLTSSGTHVFNNCQFGEDVGGIHLDTGKAFFNNCQFHDIRNKLLPNGDFDLGNNAFFIDAGGQIFITGGRISTHNTCAKLFTINNQRPSIINGVEIQIHGKTFMVSRYQSLAYAGSSFQFIGNHFYWDGSGKLFEDGVGASSSPLKNSVLQGNTFNYPIGAIITTEDWFIQPSLGNTQSGNLYREGVL